MTSRISYQPYSPKSTQHLEAPNFQQPNQEWSLIYKQIAKQGEVLEDLEKYHIKRQKREIKQHLDKQVAERYHDMSYVHDFDQKYKQIVDKRVSEELERQKLQMLQRRQQRKQMEVYNRQIIHKNQAGKLRIQNPGDRQTFNIGRQQPHEYQTLYKGKDNMAASVQFASSRKNEKLIYSPISHYHNGADKVFNIYSQLSKQQEIRKRQEQFRLFQDAERIKQKSIEQQQKKQRKLSEERRKMKQMLDYQIYQQSLKSREQKKTNPQMQVSYKIFSNLNRQPTKQKKNQQLAITLEAQSEQQRIKNARSKYMTEQEYRINFNQLNKAVNKQYNDSYQDRSLNTIGQRLRRHQNQGIQNLVLSREQRNANQAEQQMVRKKIQMLNMRRKSINGQESKQIQQRKNKF